MIGFRFNKLNKQDIKLMLLFRSLCGNEIFLVVDLHVNNQKHGYFVYIWLVAGRIMLCKSGGKFLLFQTSECLTV